MSTAKALFVNYTTGSVWVTDGTSSGTFQLPVVPDPGYQSHLLLNTGANEPFLVFGGKLLFVEQEGVGRIADQIYITDGTVAGTSEVTVNNFPTSFYLGHSEWIAQFGNNVLLLDNVISATGQPPTVEFLVTDGTNAGTMTFTIPGPRLPLNFNPGPFKSFGNLVLFSATDYSGLTSLWVSDGTGTGTKPLSVSGANTTPSNGGLHPIDLTVLGNKVLFNGSDNAGFEGLWVTDGTAAGTHELVQSQRIGVSGPVSLDPQDITIAGGKAFFSGGFSSLWVTDGTAAGTQELFVSGTLNSQGLPDPSNLTVFDNKVLFVGLGRNTSLFVSDGTSVGSFGLTWTGTQPHGLTALGDKVLFEATDTVGKQGLWVTDGTSAGTSEIFVPNAYFDGVFSGTSFNIGNELAVVGSEVLFSGKDALGNDGLWVTDATSAGTMEIDFPLVVRNLETVPSQSSSTPSPDLPWQTDGTSIFLQNDAGPAAIWTVNGTTLVGGGSLPNPGSSWHAKAAGDFFGNGNLDLLLQNDDGSAAIWETNGSGVIGGGSLGNPGANWKVASVGDFNGDGRSDILWQNTSGEVAIWEISGTSIIGGGSLGNPGSSWDAVGSGDFNDDKKSDILWQNDSGQVAIWEMSGTSIIGGGSVANPGPSWHALGTGDFNGAGFSDILLQNDSGQVAIWEMNGTNVIGGGNVANPGPSWHVMGVGDYNSDGKSDILLQSSSGDVAIWEMNGTSMIGGGSIASPGPTWHI